LFAYLFLSFSAFLIPSVKVGNANATCNLQIATRLIRI